MTIWTRHVLGELLKAFLLAVGVATFFLVVIMGAREGLRNGLPPTVVVEILPYFLPEVLGITIPICVLLAVTVVYSRLASLNEFVALMAAGIHPLRSVWVVLSWATISSLLTVGCYELSAIWGRPGMRAVILQSLPRIALARLQLDKSLTTPHFSIVVQQVHDGRLHHAVITIPPRGDQPQITISAELVEFAIEPARGTLILRCSRGEVIAGENQSGYFPDTIEREIFIDHNPRPLHRHWLGMWQIPEGVEKLREELRGLTTEMAATQESSFKRKELERQAEEVARQIRRLASEPLRRWANGFSCLGFALVGIPVALRVRAEHVLTSFFLSFTPISVLYYPLLMVSDQITTLGYLPPIAVWLANLCLVVVGVSLLRSTPS